MAIEFTCPHCGAHKSVSEQFAGQTGPCAECDQIITIPGGKPLAQRTRGGGGMSTCAIVVVACLVLFIPCAGIMTALLLPAVQAAREAARRMQCSNNLKQLGLAMHNYHDAYSSLPAPYIADQDGQPMHSWRVALLPFLERQDLYDAYNFDEPWDSPSNQALANQMPAAFKCPSSSDPDGDTNYMVVVGPETPFEEGQWRGFRDITDGTSNTIMFVEVKGANVNWLEPTDVSFSTAVAGPNQSVVGSYHPGGMNVSMLDGSVRFIPDTIAVTIWQALLTHASGETVGAF